MLRDGFLFLLQLVPQNADAVAHEVEVLLDLFEFDGVYLLAVRLAHAINIINKELVNSRDYYK
jgi:hypothetical protein